MNSKLQWCYIENTVGTYILLNDGRVYSGKSMDYLTRQEKGFCYYYYRIQFKGDKKPKCISIYKLLNQYFKDSLEHEEYYRNVNKWRMIMNGGK